MARGAAKPKKEVSMEEALWKSADKLRGSVEPAEYKHVVLSLFFLKFASDKFEAQRKLIAEKYSETDLTLVDAVRTAQNAVKKAERPADKYAALNDLTTAVKAMYRQIKNIDMNEEDATYRESLMSNYNSDLDYLMRDDYNDKAAAFNDALHNSPAYALAKLVGIGDVELFA